MYTVRHCAHCGELIPDYRSKKAVYCTSKCLQRAKAARNPDAKRFPVIIPTGTRGAVNELSVCVHLMRNGYDVYRALSPSCPCDLIAIKDGIVLRVEVKSGWYNADGSLGKYTISERQHAASDIIAWAMKDGSIIYTPELPSLYQVQALLM